MDTDDLSTEAYQGIIIEAEKFDHDRIPPTNPVLLILKNQMNFAHKNA